MLYTTCLVMLAGVQVYRGEVLVEEYWLIAPDIRLGLMADGLSVPTLAVVILLCTALALYSIRYIEHRVEILYGDEPASAQTLHFTRFFYLFPFFPIGFIGTILSTNLVSLYFFMEVLTITLFFLMAYFGYRDRVRIAFMSLSWGMIGALLFLAASLVVYSQIGSLEISDLEQFAGNRLVTGTIALFLVGLMMKLALVPFHVWMPWVHAEHPTCIAGLLAVYANVALYIIVRVIVVPLGGDFHQFGEPLMALALITMIYGSLLTFAQTDIKRLAACSTISQIAYSVLGIGALTSASVEGGMFFFLSHIMGKTIFFSTAGIIVYTTGIRDIREMGGLARKMPLTAILWVIGCMMLSGFPPFSSFTAEWIMFTGVFERGLTNGPAQPRDRDRRCCRHPADGGVLLRCGPSYFLRSLESQTGESDSLRPAMDDDRPTIPGSSYLHRARALPAADHGSAAHGGRGDRSSLADIADDPAAVDHVFTRPQLHLLQREDHGALFGTIVTLNRGGDRDLLGQQLAAQCLHVDRVGRVECAHLGHGAFSAERGLGLRDHPRVFLGLLTPLGPRLLHFPVAAGYRVAGSFRLDHAGDPIEVLVLIRPHVSSERLLCLLGLRHGLTQLPHPKWAALLLPHAFDVEGADSALLPSVERDHGDVAQRRAIVDSRRG